MHPPLSNNKLLHERDAARILGVSGSTLRRWRTLRIGPPYICVSSKPGGAIRYRESDLTAWLERNTVHGAAGGDNERSRG
jgi:hypothetical protein